MAAARLMGVINPATARLDDRQPSLTWGLVFQSKRSGDTVKRIRKRRGKATTARRPPGSDFSAGLAAARNHRSGTRNVYSGLRRQSVTWAELMADWPTDGHWPDDRASASASAAGLCVRESRLCRGFLSLFFVEKKGLAAAKTLAREQNWPGRRARTWTHATTIAGCLPAAFEEHAAQSGRA